VYIADVSTIKDELAVTADPEGQDSCKLMIVTSIYMALHKAMLES